MYEVSIVCDQCDLRRALPEWREFLSGNPDGCNFFNDPDVIEFTVARGGNSPFIVMVRHSGTLQCIAPFCVQPSNFRLQFSVFTLASLPVRLLTLFGNDFVYRKNVDASNCCALVFDAVQHASFDLSLLNAVETRSLLWKYCASKNHKPAALRFVRPSRLIDTTFRVELPATFDDYLAMLGSSTRGSLKRRTKKLVSGHGATLIKVTSSDQVPQFLNAADEIYCDSWQAKTYGPIKRNGAEEIARLQHIARHGWLRCYLLVGDKGPLAFQIGFHYSDTFHACDFAYAQQWSDFGPGAVLMYLTLQNLFQEDTPRVVDLRPGDSPQKRTFRTSPFEVADYYVIPRSRWRRVIAAQRALNNIEAVTRATIVKMGMDNAIRRFLKHKA